MSNQKRKKKTAAPKATNSFAQMVSTAQTNALKPYIDQQVQMAAFQAIQSLSGPVLNHVQVVQQTQMAMLRLLKSGSEITDDTMAETSMDIEDEAVGAEITTEFAKKGDLVRIDFKSKQSNQDEFNPTEKVQINAVAVEGPNGVVQTGLSDLETSIIGRKTGEVFSFLLPGKVADDSDEEPIDTTIEVKVLRISTKKAVGNE